MLDMGFIPDVKRVLALLPRRAPEPAVLGHVLRRDQGARRKAAGPAAHDRGDAAQFHRRCDRAARAPGQPRRQEQAAGVARGPPSLASGAGVHADQARRRQARELAPQRWPSRGGAARQQEPERTDARAGRLQGGRRSKSWSPRTSRRAASISTSCRMSSTTIFPTCPSDYIHRIGRTGRAGADGEAISLVCVDEHLFLRDIERLIKRSIPREVIAGFEPDPNAVAQPVFAQRGRGGMQGRRPEARGNSRATGHAPPRGGDGTPRHASSPSRLANSAPARTSSHRRAGTAGQAAFRPRSKAKH